MITILTLPPENMDDISVYYLLRRSSKNGSELLKQKRLIEAFIEKHNLPLMDEDNTIEDDKSGVISPDERFLSKIPDNALVVTSNLDRVFKNKSLSEIKIFRKTLVSRNIQLLLANEEEYLNLKSLLKSINAFQVRLDKEFSNSHDKKILRRKKETEKRILKKYIEFVSARMTESIERLSKERKGIKPYCERYLKDLYSVLSLVKGLDLKTWIIACFSGSLTNEYLKDNFQGRSPGRPPKLKEVLILRAIEIRHPNKTRKQICEYALKYNKKGKYTIDLNPRKISRLRRSKFYRMLEEYEIGDFETGIKEIYSNLTLPKEELSLDGLSIQEIEKIKENFPKIKGLRSWQTQTIISVKHGNHTVLHVMPGGGKSLTFLLPAMMGQMVVVISPFKTLIKNQTDAVKNIIPAAFLNSDVSYRKRQSIIKKIKNGEIALLFLTPEQLNTKKTKHARETIEALAGGVDLLVFDEAHHPKTDGSDFREAYNPSFLNKVWKKLGKPQSLSLSASLSSKSYEAIEEILSGEKLIIVRGPLTKPNVGLIQRNFGKSTKEKILWLVLMIRYLKNELNIKKIIVYVNRPAKVPQVMEQLKYDDNRKVFGVHGKKEGGLLSGVEIKKNQEDFERSKTGIMVATPSYSEGIDVDAGAVIVFDLPAKIETLYQEVLRCGHQGQKGLAFICVDEMAKNFNLYSLLDGDKEKVKEYNQNFKFLEKESPDLWEGLTKSFKKVKNTAQKK